MASFLQEIDSIIERDPAARSRWHVAFLYPSFHVMLAYRVAHYLWKRGLGFVARFIMQFMRWVTQIEIHPGAKIGSHFFIDHGSGVVIGESSEIGDHVTLYHGVTLGGVAPSIDSDSQRHTKRHPTIEDDVVVGAGAQILGDIVIGKGARVGANAVVVKNVAPGDTVTGIPAKPAGQKRNLEPESGETPFHPYGVTPGCSDDPYMEAIETLKKRVEALESDHKARAPSATKTQPKATKPGSAKPLAAKPNTAKPSTAKKT